MSPAKSKSTAVHVADHFAAGEVVNLKSGGPALTVLAQAGDQVMCVFFSEEIGEFRQTMLPAFALENYDEDADDDQEDDESDEDEDEESARAS